MFNLSYIFIYCSKIPVMCISNHFMYSKDNYGRLDGRHYFYVAGTNGWVKEVQ